MNIISENIWMKNQREINEDSLCFCHVLYNGIPIILAAICDGVGGLPGGQNASSIVISNLKKSFFDFSNHQSISFRRIKNVLSRCIYSSHAQIVEGATTLCLVLIYKNQVFTMSCGDTRIYMGRKALNQVSIDHCDSKGRLTQAIGDTSFSSIYKRCFTLKKGYSILLCSDGFYRRITPKIIGSDSFFRCSNEEMLKDLLEKLHYEAVNKGENDNSSAIIIKRLS